MISEPFGGGGRSMDTSQQYIDMCRMASEIQKCWMPEHGDFFQGEKGKVEVWVQGRHEQRCVAGNVRLRFEDGMPRTRQYIWLPRLDQLMELAQEPGKRFDQLTQIFFDWTKQDYGTQQGHPGSLFDSLEQTWLAFIMDRKFGLKWDGCEWRTP